MKTKIIISAFTLLSSISYGQSISNRVYKLERGALENLNIPKELKISPNGEILTPAEGDFSNPLMDHGKILFSEREGQQDQADFILKFKSNGKLKGKVTVGSATERLVYSAYYCCSNHSPKDCCKLGVDPSDCGANNDPKCIF
ncbi:MAG: hypothetical protein AAGG59_12325 [Bacteroidota bacterium]